MLKHKSSIVITALIAVAIITGISAVAPLSRSFFKMEIPSSPGSITSSIISSGFSLARACQNDSASENPCP